MIESTEHLIYVNVISVYKQQNTKAKSLENRIYKHLQKSELLE